LASLATWDIAHILLALVALLMVFALVALLMAAHVVGSIFSRLRQPRAIGEVVGGLLLGPTLLGYFAPTLQAWLSRWWERPLPWWRPQRSWACSC
jgi:hypothetical protein